MYTQQDLDTIRGQLKKRYGLLAIPAIVLLGLIVYSLVIRNEVMSTVCGIALGVLLVFVYDLLLKPLHCYEKLVLSALGGRRRELDCTFGSLDPDISVVEGVRYRALHVFEPGEKKDPVERLMYFDAQKTFPDVAEGAPLHVTYHDRSVIDLTVL